ncbi:MAG TPA: hypothetical protein VLY82_03445 [Nitrososphaerales archaeon]|nr:hypothetical protein [Nitrososphaerales archaeon]
MGSFFAGIKAGTLSGILYVAGLAAFNILLLYALKADVLTAINQSNPVACPMVASVNGSVQDCFDLVISVSVPFVSFVSIFVVLFISGLFGLYFDSLPGRSATVRGLFLGAITVFCMIFVVPLLFGLGLVYAFDEASSIATAVFLLCWTPAFGYLLGRLYKKYTRAVEFSSQDPDLLKVVVDGRDRTGQVKTFATTSSHKLRAEVAEGASFREWDATEGIGIEDSRSFETTMEVNGNGKIIGNVSSKY